MTGNPYWSEIKLEEGSEGGLSSKVMRSVRNMRAVAEDTLGVHLVRDKSTKDVPFFIVPGRRSGACASRRCPGSSA